MENPGDTFGGRIREARTQYGMTQTTLAERIGISNRSLSFIENRGQVEPKPKHLLQIARTLHVSLNYLFGLEPYPGKCPL